MPTKPIIAIAGATGAQGGALAHAILNDPKSPFAVRALTRNPTSEKARNLAARGAEVVAADIDNLDSVKAAFTGAQGAYCVTFFWDHFSPVRELNQAANMARAAKDAGVKHAIWSTLEDTRRYVPLSDTRMPTLQSSYKVPHFDAKGEADQIFAELGVPTTLLLTSFYWENFIYFGMNPKPGQDGVLGITMPIGDKKLPGVAVDDIGRFAYAIFRNGPEYIGKTVGIAGEHLTGAQMAASLTKALGRPIRYNAVPPDVFRGFGFPGADDIGNMFQFNADFEQVFCEHRDLAVVRRMLPDVRTFDRWLEPNASRIPLE